MLPTFQNLVCRADVPNQLRKASFDLEEENEEMTGRLRTILAVLADGRSVQRLRSGEWVILRDSV